MGIETLQDDLEGEIRDAVQAHVKTAQPKSLLPENVTRDAIAKTIDHTQLAPSATPEDIAKVCEEARVNNFKTVCVNPSRIPMVTTLLKGSSVMPGSAVGFPSGNSPTPVKAHEARWSVENGAGEVDFVIAIGHLKAKEYAYVYNDIKAVVDACPPGFPVKVILETGALERDEIIAGCVIAKRAGASFVKTSTGFGPGQATIENISLMRAVVGEDIGVKASGGIRGWEAARAMLTAGASRIGAKAGVTILDEME
ncbi:MAG: hypothetical protein M1837_004740 [Sclerophora amabilis]|nr:MAG: hypothetical protein M1837_004740 [Sclerophora amabilis]